MHYEFYASTTTNFLQRLKYAQHPTANTNNFNTRVDFSFLIIIVDKSTVFHRYIVILFRDVPVPIKGFARN